MSSDNENNFKVIIDNDAGGDDAMAIFLALLYEKYFNGPKLIGLTTCNGNTDEDNVCTNNKKILKVAKRENVPIYRGSKASLVRGLEKTYWYGKDGLGDVEETHTDLVPEQNEDAVSMLIEQSKIHEGKLVIITIGPLTNMAMAIKLDEKFLSRLYHLYIGAGHIEGEQHPLPEFNARMDAEAYHIVVKNSNPDKVTILPFSQAKESLNFDRAWREEVLGAIDTSIMRAQNMFERVAIPKNETWASLDPATLAVAIRPDLVEEYRYSQNDIVLSGEKRGINTNTFVDKDEANVRIVYKIKQKQYKQFLIEVFSAEKQLEHSV